MQCEGKITSGLREYLTGFQENAIAAGKGKNSGGQIELKSLHVQDVYRRHRTGLLEEYRKLLCPAVGVITPMMMMAIMWRPHDELEKVPLIWWALVDSCLNCYKRLLVYSVWLVHVHNEISLLLAQLVAGAFYAGMQQFITSPLSTLPWFAKIYIYLPSPV